jgi:hypothetical protein
MEVTRVRVVEMFSAGRLIAHKYFNIDWTLVLCGFQSNNTYTKSLLVSGVLVEQWRDYHGYFYYAFTS